MTNGIASITHGGKVFRFRTNPNSIRWSYKLNTNVDQTYGGRVVQLLSANVDDLVVTAEAGGGGWAYIFAAATFFRDMLFDQRNGGDAGIFEYSPRGWKMGVYALNFPFGDDVKAVARQFTMNFKVQEDISGVISTDSLSLEMASLQAGIGYKHNEYNTPPGDTGTAANPVPGATPAPGTTPAPAAPPTIPGAPRSTNPSGPIPGGLIP